MVKIKKNITHYSELLVSALKVKSKTFKEIKYISSKGLYILLDSNEIIYVGKTDRKGKIRLGEMKADYRSHTLNKKLLQELCESRLGYSLPTFNKETKRVLIAEQKFTLDEFKACQKEINIHIATNLKFKFLNYEKSDLNYFEHFVIAVLQPKYND